MTCGRNIELIRFNKPEFHTRLEGLSQQRPGGVTAGRPQAFWGSHPLQVQSSFFTQKSGKTNRAVPAETGGDGIPVELFQILKDDAVKVLHSIYQQIWKTQQRSQDWTMPVFIPIPKKGNAKECSKYCTAAAAAKSLQSCPTLCDPIEGSLSGSIVPGILQARTLEWVAIPFFRGSSQPRD